MALLPPSSILQRICAHTHTRTYVCVGMGVRSTHIVLRMCMMFIMGRLHFDLVAIVVVLYTYSSYLVDVRARARDRMMAAS